MKKTIHWCDYYENPAAPPADASGPVNGAQFYFEQRQYIPLVIDAITGELFDPLIEDRDRAVYPGA